MDSFLLISQYFKGWDSDEASESETLLQLQYLWIRGGKMVNNQDKYILVQILKKSKLMQKSIMNNVSTFQMKDLSLNLGKPTSLSQH